MLEIVRSFTEIKKLKMKNMKVELSMSELNELIYGLGIAQFSGKLVNKEVASKLEMKLRDELDKEIKRQDEWDAYVKQKCEEDAIRHEFNFKRNYAYKGDY